MLNFLIFFSFILVNINLLFSLQTESVVLFLSFFFIFFYIIFNKKIDSLFFVEEDDISFLEDLDWYIVMNLFLKIKNWYRFFYRFTYAKYASFYRFFFSLKKYIMYWLRSIYSLLVSHFLHLNAVATLVRLTVLERYKKAIKFKNNPLFFISL